MKVKKAVSGGGPMPTDMFADGLVDICYVKKTVPVPVPVSGTGTGAAGVNS